MSEGNPGEEVQGGGRGGVAESAITDLAATAGNDEDTDEIETAATNSDDVETSLAQAEAILGGRAATNAEIQ